MTASETTHFRSFDIHAEGRTLEGLAFRWEHPSKVRDPGSPLYLEEFVRGSVDHHIKRTPLVPLLKRHEINKDPIGVASFVPSAEGLMFAAPLSKTRAADETLELVNDGAERSVSLRFRSLRNGHRRSIEGPVTQRLEIAIKELSVVPTGFGQHDGAEIHNVRALDDEDLEEVAQRWTAETIRRRLTVLRVSTTYRPTGA